MTKNNYCCGCCSENEENASTNNSSTRGLQQRQNVIQLQPIGDNVINKTETVFYWEGFRAQGEEVRPETLQIFVTTQIKQIAGTENEILFLLEDGSLWSHDRTNGIRLSANVLKPTKLGFSMSTRIEFIACGKYHSLALDNRGNIYSWGLNRLGQLGIGLSQEDCDALKHPTLVKGIASKVLIQIAAGENHSVVLTDGGDLYACGSNSAQQLGINELVTHSTIFIPITTLQGIPWGFISAGGNQTFGLTIHNSVFVWGDQSKRQTAIRYDAEEEIPSCIKPTEVVHFYDYGTSYISTGKYHTAFVGKGESCSVAGSNRYNQTGPAFNEGTITQIATGEYHTVAVGNGNLYCYGPENNDIEDDIPKANRPEPPAVTLPCKNYNIFAFGNATFVVPLKDASKQNNCRIKMGGRQQLFHLSEQALTSFLRIQTPDAFVDAGLEQRFAALLKMTTWNASFQKSEDIGNEVQTYGADDYFGYNFDLLQAETFIQNLWTTNRTFHDIFVSILDNWLDTKTFDSCIHEESSPVYAYIPLIILNSPKIINNIGPQNNNSFTFENVFVRLLRDILLRNYVPADESKYLKKFASLLFKQSNRNFTTDILILIYRCYTSDQLQRLVAAYKKDIVSTLTVYKEEGKSPNAALEAVFDCLKLLRSIFDRNKQYKRISHHCFTIPQLNRMIDLDVEFTEWMQHKTFPMLPLASRGRVYLCDFPFILDGSAKAMLLQCEQKLQMFGASILSRIMEPPELYGFVLLVHRDNLLEDVLSQIFLFNPFDFKKPLRIQFVGEEGQDAGGVRKEFFLLLIRELLEFSADRGLLKHHDESHLVWFNDYNGSTEEVQFLVVFGALAGLAIYNNTIIKLPFPSAMYKKLLGENCDIEDLLELSPTEGNSLNQVLNYAESDIEEVFGLTFEVSKDELGITRQTELKPDGKNIPVTLENKEEFVELYVDNVFRKGCEKAFSMFKKGFDLVFNDSFAIKLFRPEELKEIIIGNEDYDWGRLEEDCIYKGMFHKGHKTIIYFWDVFHDLSPEMKKRFLLFLTGSDRVPISGMSGIQIHIQSVALDETYYPVAHTCFNLLDMPAYNSKEALKDKLLTAIEHKEGFYIA